MFVCLCLCVCFHAVLFCVIVCDCMFVDLWGCQCLCLDVFVLGLCVSGLYVWGVGVRLCVGIRFPIAAPNGSR